MNGVDLALGLLAAAAIATVVRWFAARRLPWRHRRDGLAEMGKVVEAARAAHDQLENREAAHQSTVVRRARATTPRQVARNVAQR
jgi:hypothetical protein